MVTGGDTKEAVTNWFEFINTEQPSVPEQAPPQPPNVLGSIGVAVKVTFVPA
jgi:hypothetical protein